MSGPRAAACAAGDPRWDPTTRPATGPGLSPQWTRHRRAYARYARSSCRPAWLPATARTTRPSHSPDGDRRRQLDLRIVGREQALEPPAGLGRRRLVLGRVRPVGHLPPSCETFRRHRPLASCSRVPDPRRPLRLTRRCATSQTLLPPRWVHERSRLWTYRPRSLRAAVTSGPIIEDRSR
jgi:hypothetical protein